MLNFTFMPHIGVGTGLCSSGASKTRPQRGGATVVGVSVSRSSFYCLIHTL